MFKLVKWDLLNFLHKYNWVLIAVPVILLLILIPQNGQGLLNNFVIFASGLLAVMLFLSLLFLAAGQPINWLRQENTPLERSLPVPSWKPLSVKVLFSLALNSLACLFLLQFSLFVGRFYHNEIIWLNSSSLSGIGVMILFLTMLDTTLMFSYMAVKSNALLCKQTVISSGILSIMLISLFAVICLYVLVISNGIILPVVTSQEILTIKGSLVINSMATLVVCMCVIIVFETVCSSLLLEFSFQQE